MKTTFDSAAFKQVSEEVKLNLSSSNIPRTQWVVMSNGWGPGSTIISLPQSGNLWIGFEIGSASVMKIGVWHQGGSVTPIQVGENNIHVNAGDMIFYQLSDPLRDNIKIAYQFV